MECGEGFAMGFGRGVGGLWWRGWWDMGWVGFGGVWWVVGVEGFGGLWEWRDYGWVEGFGCGEVGEGL